MYTRLSVFELRETGDWDIFLGPPGWARAEIGGADQWVLKQRELPGFARVNKVTSASLEYPISFFNKNLTRKPIISGTDHAYVLSGILLGLAFRSDGMSSNSIE